MVEQEYNIIKYPVATEKAIRMMEADNKLTFMVDRKAKKQEIKKALESLFKIKIIDVKTITTPWGKKKAIVMLSREFPAIDTATQLGLM